VLIVCELSGSHLGSLKNAHRLIDYAADSGADAIKLQSYHPSDFTTRDAPPFTDGPWKGQRPWDLYVASHTLRTWHRELFDHAHDKGMVAFSTPFSPEEVEFLETLDCPAYKVASLEMRYRPLLQAIRKTGKPKLLSTGTDWTDSEILDCLVSADDVLMHCVAAYPTPVGRANLSRLRHFASFRVAGLSDHSKGFMVPVLAVALGACVIEKHIKLYEDHDGPDAGFAETPAGFGLMVKQVRLAEEALAARDNTDLEAPMRALRRQKIDGKWLRTGP
jgi:N-acetylneuraminate synthase